MELPKIYTLQATLPQNFFVDYQFAGEVVEFEGLKINQEKSNQLIYLYDEGLREIFSLDTKGPINLNILRNYITKVSFSWFNSTKDSKMKVSIKTEFREGAEIDLYVKLDSLLKRAEAKLKEKGINKPPYLTFRKAQFFSYISLAVYSYFMKNYCTYLNSFKTFSDLIQESEEGLSVEDMFVGDLDVNVFDSVKECMGCDEENSERIDKYLFKKFQTILPDIIQGISTEDNYKLRALLTSKYIPSKEEEGIPRAVIIKNLISKYDKESIRVFMTEWFKSLLLFTNQDKNLIEQKLIKFKENIEKAELINEAPTNTNQ